jgi:hypothetical protein
MPDGLTVTNTLDKPEPQPRLIKDVWNAILEDGWMWAVVWGKPRTGKTTVQLKCGFEVYKDWDQVLQAIVFNLSGIIYKMEHGEPCRIMTRNMLHNRVPFLIADDFGAQSNKAKTQHEPAWDIFKGAFDTLATKVAVIMASMGNPASATQQLQEKYTHEIYVVAKGQAKYDKVDWQQNFAGWQPRQDKDWQQTFEFTPAPTDVYKQYDQMRQALVDELFTLISDSMVENEALKTIRRMQPLDVELLETVATKGMLEHRWFNDPENEKFKEVLTRCKARSLIVPVRKGTNYWYDITDFGLNILSTIQTQQAEGKSLVREPVRIKPLVEKTQTKTA